MPSSERLPLLSVVVAAAAAWSAPARAQQAPAPPQGFAVERLHLSAPGAGWFVMDDLDMRGGFGGAIALTTGYAHDPLRVATTDGTQRLAVVSDQAFVDVGGAVTYDRYRLYVNLSNPVLIHGASGTVGGAAFAAPSVDIGRTPDLLPDFRVGFDARLFGAADGPLRLGLGAQLIVPSGSRADYDTDGTYRGMIRALVAGRLGLFTYAGQVGVHVRPLDDAPSPGSPRGSELLFGVAAGPRIPLPCCLHTALAFGPEVFGETALKSIFAAGSTGLEGLLTGRLEGTAGDGAQLRLKAGAGVGIDAQFGAPEWRAVLAVEVFDHRDKGADGVR